MEIRHGKITLRDYCETDIEDEIRWMNEETAWITADTPWEEIVPVDPDELRANMMAMIESMPPDALRYRMEIMFGERHIGFVCSYPIMEDYSPVDYETLTEDTRLIWGLGIEICEPDYWHRGIGTEALAAWIQYFQDNGRNVLYLETWSGNLPMMRCAEKLGFTVCHRIPGLREVNGNRYDALVLLLETSRRKI